MSSRLLSSALRTGNSMASPTIFDNCQPRQDILNGTMSEAEFAARLGPANLHRRGELLAQARHAIVERNASARLQLERLLIDLMGMA